MTALHRFTAPTRAWFEGAFVAPTPVQERGWVAIGEGAHTLLLAPTGSGKTLAAFLWCLDRLVASGPRPADAPKGFRVLYISPLKALAYDIERNLRAPLAGIVRAAEATGTAPHVPRVQLRTGDTEQRVRQQLVRKPGDVLVTTPESLFLMLSSKAREVLRTVETVIIDEIHAVAGSKRGVHLALSMERLSELCEREPQRIGLSATQRPLEEIAAFLGGPRPVQIVDAGEAPHLDLEVIVPVPDMETPDLPLPPERGGPVGVRHVDEPEGNELSDVLDEAPVHPLDGGHFGPPAELTTSVGGSSGNHSGIWPAIHPRILDLVRAHRSTIVFTNSRRLCERLAQRLNELAVVDGGVALARAHHGSISHAQRGEIEEQLKSGTLPCIVATSSLELGIDMGAVDLVILVEAPPSVASGLQRAGRAGHGVGELSRARVFPKYRGDLLEAAVLVQRMRAGAVESTRVPTNCLDVLAQQLVGMCVARDWKVADLLRVVKRAWPYRDLTDGAFVAVLDMLSGRLPPSTPDTPESRDFATDRALSTLRPRLVWDRGTDLVVARRDARMVLYANAGTIPDRGLFGVFHAGSGARVGELDEEMVHELRRSDTILLGASTWRVVELARDRVVVEPAPGEPGRMPFWRGEGPGRPVELGRALGAFVRELVDRPRAEALEWLVDEVRLDAWAADNLLAYLDEQRELTGTLPTDRTITVERFRDELGDWRVCLLTPFGARVHAPWALAIQARYAERAGGELDVLWTDDGIVLRLPDDAELGGLSSALDSEIFAPDPDEVEELVIGQLHASAIYAARFREAAGRALILARRRPGERAPLWAQRLKAQQLMEATAHRQDFPVALEAYREVLQDVFDLPALIELMRDLRSRRVRLEEVETPTASPFARSLVFAFVATWVYEGDAPLAERRAQALSVDRHLLRELLGQDELRELLDVEVIAEVEDELQRRSPHRHVRGPDGLHDLLRVVGDLTTAEVAARAVEDPAPWLAQLVRQSRAVEARIGGEVRWIAIEEVARYRDALGAVPPGGVPAAFLSPEAAPLEALIARWARTHGPFGAAELARRYRLIPAQVAAVLRGLTARGVLLEGAFMPGGGGGESEWCDPEVLRRLKRRTLAKLRGQVAPVEAPVLARFLPAWHGLVALPGSRRAGGLSRLWDVLMQLEGYPVSFGELEGRILPARVQGYRPEQLDELGASGEIVWVGRGALGQRDGRVALMRRERVAWLLAPPRVPDDRGALHHAILALLAERGALFTSGVHQQLIRTDASTSLDAVTAALWALVWDGLLTNDTFAPLRERRRPSRARGRHAARGWRPPRSRSGGLGGRWSLVGDLLADPLPSATERALARATMLAERYGIVSRAVAQSEQMEGGFREIYPVFRELEEVARMRRGWFVDGLEGAQFAVPGAVDRLRAQADVGEGTLLLLSAVDPANPYGALLPWPEAAGMAGPRRVAGALVALWDGRPVLFLEKGGKSIVTFDAWAEPRVAASVIRALRTARPDRRSLRVSRVDGLPADEAGATPSLLSYGFRRDAGDLVLDAPL